MSRPVNRSTVLEAVHILTENGVVATRHSVADLSGLPLGKVDDHIKRLINSGQILRTGHGQYSPAPLDPPDRVIRWGCIRSGVWFFQVGEQRVELDTASPHDLQRFERASAVVYRLGAQSIELSASEDRRAGVLRKAAATADWRDAFESPADRLGRLIDSVRLARHTSPVNQ
ncbi:MAG: hypothetical protein PWQ61_1599 [Betaproteobacteria bacterium]|nr:hypothetical protein [Betaproteobacteria bacterium]